MIVQVKHFVCFSSANVEEKLGEETLDTDEGSILNPFEFLNSLDKIEQITKSKPTHSLTLSEEMKPEPYT